jgi:hypothetical protein
MRILKKVLICINLKLDTIQTIKKLIGITFCHFDNNYDIFISLS